MNMQPDNGRQATRRVKRRVLVADDHAVGLILAETVLKLFDCDVVCVRDGLAACEAVESSAFDLVLLDVHMPIIALTASAEESEQAAAIAAGMDAVLLKPYRLADMGRVLDRWCPPRPLAGAAAPSEP